MLGSLDKSSAFHAGGGVRDTGQVGASLDSMRDETPPEGSPLLARLGPHSNSGPSLPAS